ncbi:hypothetical protein A2192_00125 [Candidatus Nomurabacteria bacterium RIFOXYA1_FULL_35_17]|uniref:Uncharacterized protein n=1 Tax=Candidatus Nomurabacteria bacterium RIFOXYA1_FULL_35_17 TaxID=1801798 RepID=A0A1F6YKE8_9BACT|nr:MAG: hypothetical protein A2192_00125 [Candidatus Nomurabacteria bacterium RIFOXYA1_FULL_35_17]
MLPSDLGRRDSQFAPTHETHSVGALNLSKKVKLKRHSKKGKTLEASIYEGKSYVKHKNTP